jgi:hypothetical protein
MAKSFVAQLALLDVFTKHLVFKFFLLQPSKYIKKKKKKKKRNLQEPNVNSVSFYLVWNSCT